MDEILIDVHRKIARPFNYLGTLGKLREKVIFRKMLFSQAEEKIKAKSRNFRTQFKPIRLEHGEVQLAPTIEVVEIAKLLFGSF